jgi:bifunctional non-homologous end joining protein LigD
LAPAAPEESARHFVGHLHFHLNGKKLKGEWQLRRMGGGERERWLLIKSSGNARVVSKKRDDSSAITGRSMAEIAGR